MPNDNHNLPPEDNANDADLSASSLFLEMMRRAAAETPDPPPSSDLDVTRAPDSDTAFLPDDTALVSDDDYYQDDDVDAYEEATLPYTDGASSQPMPPFYAEAEDIEDSADPVNTHEEDTRFYNPENRLPSDGLPDIDLDALDDHAEYATNTLSTASVTSEDAEPDIATPSESQPPEPDPTPEDSPHNGRVPIYKVPVSETLTEAEVRAKIEAQRVRRLRRRQQRRQRRRVGILGGFARTTFIGLVTALLASTIFTWFTDPDFFTPGVVTGLQTVNSTSVAAAAPLTPTAIPVTPNWARRIGIVSGHRGPENDPGAVCDDGLTEAEINFAVAQLVVLYLRERGYSVDLLDEFDPRLDSYQAAALVSIHANDCRDYGEYVSGYLVARAAARPEGGLDDVLAECVARDYGTATALERRFSLTVDMTDYHTFREIHPLTPAAIIELGFMRDDRELLTTQQETIAEGITDGILCFLNGENPNPPATDIAPTTSP